MPNSKSSPQLHQDPSQAPAALHHNATNCEVSRPSPSPKPSAPFAAFSVSAAASSCRRFTKLEIIFLACHGPGPPRAIYRVLITLNSGYLGYIRGYLGGSRDAVFQLGALGLGVLALRVSGSGFGVFVSLCQGSRIFDISQRLGRNNWLLACALLPATVSVVA